MKKVLNCPLLTIAILFFSLFVVSCQKEKLDDVSLESQSQVSVSDRSDDDLILPTTWIKQKPDSRLKKLFNTNGQLWGINASNSVYRWENNDWVERNAGSKLVKIVSAGNEIWGINPENRVYRWINQDWVLSNANTHLKNIIPYSYPAYGIDPDNNVFYWSENSQNWFQFSNNVPMKSLEVDYYTSGSFHLWGLGMDDQVYRRESNPDFSAWAPRNTNSKLKKLVWTTHLWGINPDNNVYRWENNDWVLRNPGSKLVKIIPAGGYTWGINPDDNVYRWQNNTWAPKNAGSKLNNIYAIGPFDVWGVSASGMPYKWANNDWIPYSLPENIAIVQLIAGLGRVWAIDDQDQIWTLMSETVTPPPT